MFIIVTYDIPDNKIRTRVHKALMRYGEPVQFSVFECIISNDQFDEMRKAVSRIINIETDSVRYYEVCDGCYRRIITIGKAQSTSLKTVYIV
jgi:CRISPR-associated protein Cas2